MPAHKVSVRGQFFGYAFRDRYGGDASRLRAADESVCSASDLEADFGDLCCFTRSRFAANYNDRVGADCIGNLAFVGSDREDG